MQLRLNTIQAAEKVTFGLLCNSARLHTLLKKSLSECFVTGHDFSRADKPFILVIPSGPSETVSQPAKEFSGGTNRLKIDQPSREAAR